MPICIECTYPVETLYMSYSKADDRSLGKGVRLTQCPRCKRFADKYVEHDFVVLFIDLVLIKPQVYRHLLFNRLGRDDDRFDPSIIRLSVLLLLFDVYLTWARIEKLAAPSPLAGHDDSSGAASSSTSNHSVSQLRSSGSVATLPSSSFLSTQPLMAQYVFFLILVFLETLAFHLPIRLLCTYTPRIPLPSFLRWRKPSAQSSAPNSRSSPNPFKPSSPQLPAAENDSSWVFLFPHHPHPSNVSTALTVSSCTKLFPLLRLIWDFDLPSSATAVSCAVIVNNISAIEFLTDCGYLRAVAVVGVGAMCRALVGGTILRCVGLGDVDLFSHAKGLLSGLGGLSLWEWGS